MTLNSGEQRLEAAGLTDQLARSLTGPACDARTLGGVCAYDQPGVEAYKSILRARLS